MQEATYNITDGGTISLWRGIPAQITISGVEDTSGDWLFLVDNDFSDGVILSGTVAADNGTLVVTLGNMNTVELAAAIQGRSVLQCRATLTDGTSRVYIIPLTIRNRAVSGTPTPVAEYYTKAQVDALIAGLEPGGTDDYNELDNKPAINSVTLTGNKSAADLGLLSSDGLPIVALESGTIPAPGAVYTLTPSAATEFAFPTPVSWKDNFFRLAITMPDPAVAVTFPSGLTWKFATPALTAGTTSELAFAWNGSAWEGWAVPNMSEYALAADTMPIHGTTMDSTGFALTGGYLGRQVLIKIQDYGVSVGNAASTSNQNQAVALGAGCYAVQASTACGFNVSTVANTVAFGRWNATPTGTEVSVFGCGSGANDRANAWAVLSDKTFVVRQAAVFDGSVTFTIGDTTTTIAALEARIAALEQAIQ